MDCRGRGGGVGVMNKPGMGGEGKAYDGLCERVGGGLWDN